jgi:hypothetical protein
MNTGTECIRANTDDIAEALAAARPGALALLHELANDPNPGVAAEARKILRRHASRLSEVVKAYSFAQQRRRERNERNERQS